MLCSISDLCSPRYILGKNEDKFEERFDYFRKMDFDKLKENAQKRKKEFQRIFEKPGIKASLDTLFYETHDEVFEKTDCLACANCCKTTSPIFIDKDIERISKHLRMKSVDFVEKYLEVDNEDDYVLKQSPCVFLGADNQCSIYDNRPRACREYPHTNRKYMHRVKTLTLKNAEICPAVYQILDSINMKIQSKK